MHEAEIQELNRIWRLLDERMRLLLHQDRYRHLNELSNTEMGILKLLQDHPDAILKDITQRMNLPKSTLTSIVNRLTEKGYVQRVVDQADKRALRLQLTDLGAAAQREHGWMENEMLFGLVQRLNKREAASLISLLKKGVGEDGHA